jgi:hypothetical protein
VCAYYERILQDRLLASGKVTFYPNCEYVGGGHFESRLSGKRYAVGATTRIVDARYLAPEIPATTRAPFAVADGARVVAVNELVDVGEAAGQYVIVGSGKTATDACVWLLANGVDPDAICWVRPRDPWMLNRAVVQPNPAVFLGMAGDILDAAGAAESAEDLFLRLEDAGVMLRIDRTVTPTMARTPTLASWELEQLRTIENVVRLGHVRRVEPNRLTTTAGEIALPDGAVVVHCAASGLRCPPLVPIWGPAAITLQLIRAGFPCFAAALAGYVEATFQDDDEKNRLCPPSPYSNTPADWVRMQLLGTRAALSFGAHPDVSTWANGVALNPARIPPESAQSTDVVDAVARFRKNLEPGMAALTALLRTQPS